MNKAVGPDVINVEERNVECIGPSEEAAGEEYGEATFGWGVWVTMVRW